MTTSPTERGADLVLAVVAILFVAALAVSLAGTVEPLSPRDPTPTGAVPWEEVPR